MLFQMALFERDTQYIVEAGTGMEPVYRDWQSAEKPLYEPASAICACYTMERRCASGVVLDGAR